jgi:DNA repair exonuclease SbcCD ATPase subunit
MQIEQITLEGFLSYKQKQTIDLSSVSICLVLGRINGDLDLSNGAGKSSLFESIPVNFFGKGSGRADLLDSYINDDMSKMYLETIFRIDNQRFKTVRTKLRSSGTVFEIFQDSTNKEIDKATWKKTDRSIEDILGLSAKTYSSTIYLNERESLQVITGTSSERKEILRELLNIDIYEKASKSCNRKFDDFDKKFFVNLELIKTRQQQIENESCLKEDLVSIESELRKLKQGLKLLEKTLKDKNEEKKKIEILIETQKTVKDQIVQSQKVIDEFEKEKKNIQIDINSIKDEIEKQKKSYSAFKSDIEAKIKEIPDLEKQINTHEIMLKELDKVDKEFKVVTEEIKQKVDKKSKLITSGDVAVAEAKPINQLLSRLDEFGNVCPVTELECPVIKGDYKDELKRTKTEELQKNIEKTDKIQEQLKVIAKELKELRQKENDLEQKSETRQNTNEALLKVKLSLQTIESNKTKLVEKEKEFKEYLEQCEKDVEKLNKQKFENEEKLKEFNKNKNDLEIKLDSSLDKKLSIASNEVLIVEKDISEEQLKLNSKNQKLGEVKNSLETIEKMKKDIEVFIKNNEELTKQKKIYQSLSTIFGKDGIQKAIIKESIPMLEKYTSEFLKIFNDDSEKIKIKFDLDPRTQDGEYKKGGGLDILVLEEGKEPKDLQMYSGGETVRIVFSIVLSLAKLLSLRAGKKHESLIIDEKIAKLDSRGIEQFGEVIREISKIYKQVFVITHIESLKNMISGNEIIVNKVDNEGSLVSVV